MQADDPLPGGRESERTADLVPAGVAAKMSDFFTLRAFRRLGLHAAMCRPLGIDYVMKIYLETGSPGASVIFDRGGRDFSERDRAVLNTLGPHLALIRRRTRESRTRPENEITSMLTAREREVLDLVACGWTNGEIAAALFIAQGTVRKHLDNVYAKLGVRSRAQAVATIRAYPDAAGGAAAGIIPVGPTRSRAHSLVDVGGQPEARQVGDDDGDDDQRRDREARADREEQRDHHRRQRQPQHGHARRADERGDGLGLLEARQVGREQARDGTEEDCGERGAAAEAPERDAPGKALEQEEQHERRDRERRSRGEQRAERLLPGEEDGVLSLIGGLLESDRERPDRETGCDRQRVRMPLDEPLRPARELHDREHDDRRRDREQRSSRRSRRSPAHRTGADRKGSAARRCC